MARFLGAVSLFVTNAFMIMSLFIFASGFFPYKSFQSGRASFSEAEELMAIPPPFDKVIFMVVDALRRSQSGSIHGHSLLLTVAATLYMRLVQGLGSLSSTSIITSFAGNP